MQKLLLISNVNLDPITRYSGDLTMDFDGYDTLFTRLHQPIDDWAKNYDGIWVHIELNALLSSLPSETDELKKQISHWLNEAVKDHSKKLVFSTGYASSVIDHGLSHSWEQQKSMADWNQFLDALCLNNSNANLFRFDRLVARHGEQNTYDARTWLLGKIPYSFEFIQSLRSALEARMSAIFRPAKKLLILDLDHTLWHGVLEESESQPIELAESDLGKIYQAFQRQILHLKQRGVLLAIVSKNDQTQVEFTLKNHPDMVLRNEHFVRIIANWNRKSGNIQNLANDLNLSEDSFVFIDDDPRERLEVSEELPGIEVPEFPTDPSELLQWFTEDVVQPHFDTAIVTEPDSSRTEFYQNKLERESESTKHRTLDEYLESLEIHLTIEPLNEINRERAIQLLGRANQFNLNKTISPNALAHDPDSGKQAFTGLYKDRFGSEGIVGIIGIDTQRSAVTAFAVSCRVFEKRVEHALLQRVNEQLNDKTWRIEVEDSGKNQKLLSFFEELGFKLAPPQTDYSVPENLSEILTMKLGVVDLVT